MLRDYAGPGTLIVEGKRDARVTMNIVADEKSGWYIVHGLIRGDQISLAAAYENNQRAALVHNETGILMKLTIADRPENGIASVTVDVSSEARARSKDTPEPKEEQTSVRSILRRMRLGR